MDQLETLMLRVPTAPSTDPRRAAGLIGFDIRALHRARLSRDPRFDGRFYIAVTTTGIYCRPICPSPTSRREHVVYYATVAAAAAAGFRPCRRCRPEAAPGSPAWPGTSAVVRRALRLIGEGALDHGSVEQLSELVGIGARHLHRLFVQHVGASPIAVAQTRRLHFAKRLLDDSALPITEIALASGFGSVRRFNSAFRLTFDCAPRDVRRQPRSARSGATVDEVVLRLAYRPPYDWRHALHVLAARAIPGVETVTTQGYARTVVTAGGPTIVRVWPVESAHALYFSVHGAGLSDLLWLSSTARRVFDLAADPAAIIHAFKSDQMLAPLVRRRPGVRIVGVWDPFECAVSAIVTGHSPEARTRSILGRLVALAGQPVAEPTTDLTHLFPTPSAVASCSLDGIGVSSRCRATLRALAQAVVEGRLNLGGPVETITEQLAALSGVDAALDQHVALYGLGEPDAFPIDAAMSTAVIGTRAGIRSRKALELRAERWRPWRGYAAAHLTYSSAARAKPPERNVAERLQG